MRRLVVIVVVVAALAGGAATALAAVVWPSTATTFAGVNTHLNALHNTDLNQLSTLKIVSSALTQSGGNSMEGSVACPTGWKATGGGVLYPATSPNGGWYISASGPWPQMGTTTPVGWKAMVSNPTMNPGDPIPTDIRVYAVCAT